MHCISSEWEELIYRDLARGIYCPDQAEVEAFGPLPPEEHTGEEYTTLEVQELLSGIAENVKSIFQQGETLNRFSVAYADLCPRMMDLLRLAACALSTLYVNGEDVNAAAVSILDLRRLGSFHFRKCHAAARAALGRNETIWVRTSALELQWAKLLLRLKQTEVRFSRPLPQPKTAPAMVPAALGKLPESEFASAPEPVRALPRTAAVPAASPFRAPRPASQSAVMPPFQPEPSPQPMPAANVSAEVRRGVPPTDKMRETPLTAGPVKSQSGSEEHKKPLPELPQAMEHQKLPRSDESRRSPQPCTPRKNPQAEKSVIDLDEEDLRLLMEFRDLQSFRESRDHPVSRDLRLSDLFVPYDPDDPPPDSV